MPKLKKIEHFDQIGEIFRYFSIKPFEHIIEWAQKNINFSDDVSNERDRLDFDTFPYQIDPIKEWEDLNTIKTVTLVFPQQRRQDKHISCWPTLEDGV